MHTDLPDLTDDVREALRDSIAANGVLVPVIRDRSGAVVDGRHRLAICEELGITDVPSITLREGVDADLANTHVNVLRRQLDPAWQRREMVRLAAAGRSERAIAKVVDLPRTTVRRQLQTDGGPDGPPSVLPLKVTGSDGVAQRRAPRTAAQLLALLDRHDAGEDFEALAAEEGVSRDYVRDLVARARKLDRDTAQTEKTVPANGKTRRNEWHYRKRHLDPVRIVTESVAALQGIAAGLALITAEDVNDVARREWARDMKAALADIQKFQKGLARP